ncbi:MAG: hemopexin repeat-containing protein [Candidatus Electrothrix sp. YB6]
MSMKNNFPTYASLFGNIDFKKGDEARSVYSPAAYLTDLLQVLDDEFVTSDELTHPIDFHDRRKDIKKIDLDEENTNTLIPYLDVVNEVLEGRVSSDTDTVYSTLLEAEYPFNMPFSLNNEKIKNHLEHLGISASELRRLFATNTDYTTVAREYLGLSEEEFDFVQEPSVLFFDGSDDYVDCGSNISVTDSVTVEAWVKHDQSGQGGHIVNCGGGWTDKGWSLFWYKGNIRVELKDTSKTVCDNPAPSDGEWAHVAFTWEKTSETITTYINGKAQSRTCSFAQSIGIPSQNLNIGRNQKRDWYFKGEIADVRVWNIARSADEIKSYMNDRLSGTEDGLVGYWKLNERNGTAADTTGNGNDGTVSGATAVSSSLFMPSYGYVGSSFVSDMSSLSAFMETTDLEAEAVRELLYQQLYIDPSNHSNVEAGRENFYINTGLADDENSAYSSGYVALSADETTLEWNSLSDESSTDTTTLPLQWFDRVSRFVRFAQKTGLSFTELDQILGFCCQVDDVPTISEDTLLIIAQVVWLHKTFDQPIDTIIAVLSLISSTGRSNEDYPQDQFNRIFNLPCVKVDEKYLHIDEVMGDKPEQYADTTYHDYEPITYYADLFSDDNDDYRKRLRHTLGFTETDLINITERLEYEEISDSSLWEKTENQWELLNILYRIHALSKMLDVHFLELFIMFDLLEQDPFIGRLDPHTYFIYPETADSTPRKCFDIFVNGNVNDRLWLFESLAALNKWMKEFGYSAEMLWKIVNGAPMTDKEEKAQKKQNLTIYNAMLEGFKSQELTPETFTEALGDERAARFAYGLVKGRCSHPQGRHMHKLLKYMHRETRELAEDFIRQLDRIHAKEFIGLSLEDKLQEKIFRNLIIHEVIDGSGNILSKSIVPKETETAEGDSSESDQFSLEYDFSEVQDEVFDLFHGIYQENADQQAEEIEIQVFKSDLKELGLAEPEAKELYDTLIFNGYIDEQGYAQDVEMFSEPGNADAMQLSVGLNDLDRHVLHHLTMQLEKFEASRVMISKQMFESLELKPVALDDLMTNLRMNRYIDEDNYLTDKVRIIRETPATLELALQFYPHRRAICQALQDAVADDKANYLKVDKAVLRKIADKAVSRWVYEDLQENWLQGHQILPEAGSFFREEENKAEFSLRPYFDKAKSDIVFTHLMGIITYADTYTLTETALSSLDFDAGEIKGVRLALQEIGVLNDRNVLNPDQVPFFLIPENAADFTVPEFEDYDKEIFFLLYEAAQAVDKTVKGIDGAMKEQSMAQENFVIEQLQGMLGIDPDAVKMLSKAIFKVEDNLHFAWLQPLFAEANVLNRLDKLPRNMLYTQAVKRIRQLALLIKKLQLDNDEITIALEDQDLVAKFPEDLILPDDDEGNPVTDIDALLETEEFIYLFKDAYYWIYLAEDYTMIDKKVVVAGRSDEEDDLLDLQREDEARQKRLKEDPIRQLFDEEEDLSKVDAAFIDQYGTWCVISGADHYVRYADSDSWDRRDNNFGQVDNEFDNLEMIDAAYVDEEGRLFLFSNDKYIRYSNVDTDITALPSVDQGYPKSIAEDWNDENQPVQLPEAFSRDLGPMFDGTDDYSYAFLGDQFVSSEDGQVRAVAEKWGHSEYDFGHADHIDAAMASNGDYLLFLNDKVVKYCGSIELANLQPEEGYPKPIYEEFTSLPDKFVSGVDAALHGLDDKIYLFRDDDCATIQQNGTVDEVETNTIWGQVTNRIAENGTVDAAFVGLDGRTYLFSGSQYVRYSGSDYQDVDDGFPRDIVEDWEGLTTVTAAFVLDNKTYLFGTKWECKCEDGCECDCKAECTCTCGCEEKNVYVRYSTLHMDEDDYLEVDEEDSNARTIETVLANRTDVDEIEVFPAVVNEEFWSLPESLTGGAEDFQIDAVMNGPDGKVFLFFDKYFIEHDHANRWWSEPKIMSEQWDWVPDGLDKVVAAFTGKDGKTYLFYESKFLRFSDAELYNLDNGYPRPTKKYWGRVRNNIEKTGRVDAALVVESRWEEQDKEGQLTDYVEMHTYLFSGDQMFRYKGTDYSAVEQGYPRSISRIKEEPRFRGLEVDFPDGIDAAFGDQRQIYLFRGDTFHVVIGDEDNYKQYEDWQFTDIAAVTQEGGVTYVLGNGQEAVWNKLNHLDARTLQATLATPRAAEKAADAPVPLSSAISAVLHGTDGRSYVFAGDQVYDVALERTFPVSGLFGRSRNPIYDQETIDAAFVGRDDITYVFSGEWFVQYDKFKDPSATYMNQPVVYPPRRIRDKWHGLDNVALAYVWKEVTYLFERPDTEGRFRYLRYSEDSYERPDAGYPQTGDHGFWQIPEQYLQEGFDQVDAIFVHEDNLIFISDQKFISFDLKREIWGYPRELDLIYSGIPFNKTNFKDLKTGFVDADGKAYFFSEQCWVYYDPAQGWSDVSYIKDSWGLQANIFDSRVDAAYVTPEGITYLFAGTKYARYSSKDYRYVDESYPKEIATYLRSEPTFAFMTKEFQQHLDEMETDGYSPFFNGVVDNGRCVYFFTRDTLFTGSADKYAAYSIDGLGHIENNFTAGGYVDAAFVNAEKEQTYLFSGEQYIRYTGDNYRYMDAGYPKIIAESLADELGIDSIGEDYRDGIDAAFYLSGLGIVFFNERNYLHINSGGSTEGNTTDVFGKIDNAFADAEDKTIDGAYVDDDGALYVFKGEQFIRYSDTEELFALNPYDEARYVDEEYPQDITDQWPQLDSSILTENGMDTVFRFEDEIHFHTDGNFVTYAVNLSDHDHEKPVQVLAYRWGEWSDYLLSDVHALSRFKDLGQKFNAGDITLTEFVSGAQGEVKEPYMHFAAIFGFEKEEVRWVKQRNAFLPDQVNVLEEDFDLELVLRLYDILSTTQRIRVDVSALYNNVWLNLYGTTTDYPNYAAAAQGAYDVLVQVDCDNNYEVLVNQITDELNTIKRDALVPYVIANDTQISTTRQLYQKLLIDIQMSSEARTSRIKEAIAATQLYLHRYLVNLEEVDLDADDQQAAKDALREQWQWMRSYRVWEANRKVFLYPENYIRPELRDTVSPAFEALQESLSQGELTEDMIEEAYFKYLDAYTEVSELTIAGGYVYDDDDDKVLVLFGRTRTDPMRYFYRFATFADGDSSTITWDPWEELEIKIESTRVEPMFAFNRVFVFWAVLEETTSDASSGTVTTTESEDGKSTYVSSESNIQYQIKIYYSFYNLNKRWSQPQLLVTTFKDDDKLLFDYALSEKKISLFVENSTNLEQNDASHDYKNIHIRVRYSYDLYIQSVEAEEKAQTAEEEAKKAVGTEDEEEAEKAAAAARKKAEELATAYEEFDKELKEELGENYSDPAGDHYKAFNLTPELYSSWIDSPQSFANSAQEVFTTLFHEDQIEEHNAVMLNAIENSLDGPWFAYNHKGSGFLVKPDAEPLDSSDWTNEFTKSGMPYDESGEITITAAVQAATDGDIYFFLSDKTYQTLSGNTLSDPAPISSRWGIESTEMEDTGTVDSAFVVDDSVYLTLDGYIYKYDGSSFDLLIKQPYTLAELFESFPDAWTSIDAAFTNSNDVTFWFNNETGTVLRSDAEDNSDVCSIRSLFGLSGRSGGPISSVSVAAAVYEGKLHLIDNDQYTVYNAADSKFEGVSADIEAVVNALTDGREISGEIELGGDIVTGMMTINGGVLARCSDQQQYFLVTDGTETNITVSNAVPVLFDNVTKKYWTSGLHYTDSNGVMYYIVFFDFGTSSSWGRVWDDDNDNKEINTIYFDNNNSSNKSLWYKIGVHVTAAFPSSDGSILIIITNSDTYHLFSNEQLPEEILEQLKNGSSVSGNLADLDMGVYLGTKLQDNNIWLNNQVDAALVGSENLGEPGALYLFSGGQYCRFTPKEDGEYSNTADDGYPKNIEGNEEGFPADWTQVDAAFTSPEDRVSYLFNNNLHEYYRDDSKVTATTVGIWGVYIPGDLALDRIVDAAYSSGDYLYLFAGTDIYRYTLNDNGSVPEYIDSRYPQSLPDGVSDIDATFTLGEYIYFFSGDAYYRLDAGIDPTELGSSSPITGNWGNIPYDIRTGGLSAAYSAIVGEEITLYFIQNSNYLSYTYTVDEEGAISYDTDAVPYELNDVNYELIRLTSSTAEKLNQILFAGEVEDLLSISTQEINESPTISFDASAPDNIGMAEGRFSAEPVNSHLDFNSANGIYYWEIFFHAPFLIAQTLNADQKFEYAKKWYEYIYDPTETGDYWKFLPFLAADPEALMATLMNDLDNFEALTSSEAVQDARDALDGSDEEDGLADVLEPFQDVFLGLASQSSVEEAESVKLEDIESWSTYIALADAVDELLDTVPENVSSSDKALLTTWQSEMQEALEIIKRLDYRIGLMQNYSSQLEVYLEDPFDPHAVAALRTIAYRKAIVMRYVDNLLDWGDMLFRQYTRESINEARMLYILAYDLLGEKPENMGQVVLEKTKTYAELNQYTGAADNEAYEDYDFLIDLENSLTNEGEVVYEQSLSFAATQFDTVTNPYFYLKENELFTEYWDRVEDRLSKIRACLNIDGIAQPLPLFQPPIDPMALVNAVAGGGGAAAAVLAAAGAATVPDYRFSALLAKARTLIDKLKSLGDNLLSTLEKKDSEELSLLQNKQEAMMLELSTFLKEEQIKEAEISLENLKESRERAKEQKRHYEGLISAGYLAEEETQIGMMTAGAVLNGVVALGRVVAGLSHVVPQVTAGPFSFGVTSGGRNVGDMLGQFAEATQSAAEALSMGGEVAGVVAQYKRSKQDWELQQKMAASEIRGLEHEIEAQKLRIAMARHELLMHEKDMENNESIATFMKSKFSNQQLYSWMSNRLAGLFFQTYKMAHDYAKQAEQAFIFEKGIKAGQLNYISGMYWDSRRKGLLAGAALDLDMDRMEKDYMDSNSRSMEITKSISLLETDPLALLQLKTKGYCTFRLSEELFDYDFPGHYNRQIKTISLAFDIGEGQSVNATLTQLNSKLVMAADIKAVKHLLDPANEANTNVRVNWRANQQVALSHVDQYTENNGMFELNFHDERYLPFEGTGAVSNWRLELNGKKGSYNPADLLDVTIKLRYTASQGGQRFATEVKGLLKPYNATAFFDLAYNFPDEWEAVTKGDSNDITISFTREMFPNMSSSRIIGLFIRYEYEEGNSGAIFTINDDLQVPNNTYLQPTTLSIGQQGADWKFTLKGDKTFLKNAEMVLVYKAKV